MKKLVNDPRPSVRRAAITAAALDAPAVRWAGLPARPVLWPWDAMVPDQRPGLPIVLRAGALERQRAMPPHHRTGRATCCGSDYMEGSLVPKHPLRRQVPPASTARTVLR